MNTGVGCLMISANQNKKHSLKQQCSNFGEKIEVGQFASLCRIMTCLFLSKAEHSYIPCSETIFHCLENDYKVYNVYKAL